MHMMTENTIETHFRTDPEHPNTPFDLANDYLLLSKIKMKTR